MSEPEGGPDVTGPKADSAAHMVNSAFVCLRIGVMSDGPSHRVPPRLYLVAR
jgi:hypothetical protein